MILMGASPEQPSSHTGASKLLMSPASVYLLGLVHKERLPSFLFLEVEYGPSHNETTIFQTLCSSLQEKSHPSGDHAVSKFPVATL